ncbi:MAG: GGDEF domain-containing protein [Spirochaetes bacterium]|nr:GGDEF domain-containing protein [Spirochaetota bacterium]
MSFFQISLVAMCAIVISLGLTHIYRFFLVYKRAHYKYLYLGLTAFGIALFIAMQFALSLPLSPNQILLFHRIKIIAVIILVPAYLTTMSVIASGNDRTTLQFLLPFFIPSLCVVPFNFFLSYPTRQMVIATPLGNFNYAIAQTRIGYTVFSILLVALFIIATVVVARSRVIQARKFYAVLMMLPVGFAFNDFLVVHGILRHIVLSEYYFFVLLLIVSFAFLREESDNQERLAHINAELEARIKERTMELEKANTQLLALATTDMLTGLDNRQKLISRIKEERSRYLRYRSQSRKSFSAVFIDLDNFKYYNDTFGHQAGDLILQLFSELLRQMVRTSDIVSRFGGDEFVIILPETESTGAEEFAARIPPLLASRKHFHTELCTFLKRDAAIPRDSLINCSIGIATYGPEMEIDKLLANADKALYTAKSRGKCCYAVWGKDVS